MRRRSFLFHVSALSMWRAASISSSAATLDGEGCGLARGMTASLDTTSRSGLPGLDRALITEVKKVDQVFKINPGYRFLRDGNRPNAYATPDSQVNGTSGTVLLGLTLMGTELQTEYGGAAIAGISAHEGAHILQFNSPDIRQRLVGPTAQHLELHADFMAGYYFSRTGRTEKSLIVFAESLFSKGDYQYNAPDHHGTPKQRVASMRAGYGAGGSQLSQAAEQGVEYVQNA